MVGRWVAKSVNLMAEKKVEKMALKKAVSKEHMTAARKGGSSDTQKVGKMVSSLVGY